MKADVGFGSGFLLVRSAAGAVACVDEAGAQGYLILDGGDGQVDPLLSMLPAWMKLVPRNI